jgi:hypothetical protein
VIRPLLELARELGARESGLAVAVTSRLDGSPQASVVNAGLLEHPITGELAIGFVARGGGRKLANVRARPRATVVFRSGWDWVAVEGEADLVGPDDELTGWVSPDVSRLLREVYAAAVGGSQEDWTALDDVMAAEHHTAVLLRPLRAYSNPEERDGR